MADVLAQQISMLLSLDTQSHHAAIESLSSYSAASSPAGQKSPSHFAWAARYKSGSSDRSTTCSEVRTPSPASPADAAAREKLLLDSMELERTDSIMTVSTHAGSSTKYISNDSVLETSSHCSDAAAPEEESEQPPKPEVTTLKIKNLPRRCMQDEVVAAVHKAGFAGAYDFFFLPWGSIQSRQNRGYAFINFADAAVAAHFQASFQHRLIREKAVEVVPAQVQGLLENVDYYTQLSSKSVNGTVQTVMLSF